MSKLTLSVDEAVVRRAKHYAAKQGTSVSRIVEEYLDLVSQATSREGPEPTPLLRRLRQELKGVTVDTTEYRRHLVRKYR